MVLREGEKKNVSEKKHVFGFCEIYELTTNKVGKKNVPGLFFDFLLKLMLSLQ